MHIMAVIDSDWLSNIRKFMEENTDHRTKDWPLVGNPTLLTLIILVYLYVVCYYGPNYMKHRKPYNLKHIITFYNLGQIAACVYLSHGLLTGGWLDEYSLGCQPVDESMNPRAYKMATLVWWTIILKITEFGETVFFVLRKKENQVSNLHLYHHVSTLIIAWLCCKFAPGGMATLPILINCIVHICMYTYYLIALHGGKELQKKLQSWKKAITVMQMTQFVIVIIHSLSALRADCRVPNFLVYIFTPNIFILYYMFYKFYQASYKKVQ